MPRRKRVPHDIRSLFGPPRNLPCALITANVWCSPGIDARDGWSMPGLSVATRNGAPVGQPITKRMGSWADMPMPHLSELPGGRVVAVIAKELIP